MLFCIWCRPYGWTEVLKTSFFPSLNLCSQLSASKLSVPLLYINHKKQWNMPAWPCPWGAQFGTTCEKPIPHSHVAYSRTCSHGDSSVCDPSSTQPVVIRTCQPVHPLNAHTRLGCNVITASCNGAVWAPHYGVKAIRCCLGSTLWREGNQVLFWDQQYGLKAIRCCLDSTLWLEGNQVLSGM